MDTPNLYLPHPPPKASNAKRFEDLQGFDEFIRYIVDAIEVLRDTMTTGVNTIDITGTQGQSPDDIPDQSSINAWDDEFEGDAIDTAGTRRSGAKAWTWYNQGTSTGLQNRGRQTLRPQVSGVPERGVAILQEAPTAPWRFRCKCQVVKEQTGGNYFRFGMCVYDENEPSGGYLAWVGLASHSGHFINYGVGGEWNADLGGSFADNTYLMVPHYFEIENDGTYIYFRWSASGVDGTFNLVHTETIGSASLDQVTHIGLFGTNGINPGICEAAYEWWRRME